MCSLGDYDNILTYASFRGTIIVHKTRNKAYYRFFLYFQLNITVLSVEYVHSEKPRKEYERFMSEKGYRVHADIHLHQLEISLYVDDIIFVKNAL